MHCLELLASLPPPRGEPLVVSITGGGGKTSLLFALAADARRIGSTVLVTTTTRIYDPRAEQRSFDAFQIDERWATPSSQTAALPRPDEAGLPAGGTAETGFVCVAGAGVAAGAGTDHGKLVAVDPVLIDAAKGWGLILVEADGARHRPLKAPADHEPVIPASSGVVIAVMGLDCLGKPLDDAIAFRPELVARATGLPLGSRIEPRLLAALAAAESGCFKGAPAGAYRVLVLNKLDLAGQAAAQSAAELVLESGAADLVALATLSAEDPGQRIAVILKRS